MSSTLPPAVESELSLIAERMAAILDAVPPEEALSALLAFNAKLSLEREKLRADPSNAGAPPDAPKPVPVPAEVLDEANRTYDANEIAGAIREIRSGGGRKLEDFLPELEKLAPPGDSSHG